MAIVKPPLLNTVRLVVYYTGPNGTKANNVFHVLMGTGWSPSPANLATLAENFFTTWFKTTSGGGPGNYGSTIWTGQSVTCYDNGGTTENEGVYTAAAPGGTAGNCLPPQCANTISWNIPAHYKGGHPRTYLPGTPEAALVSPGSNQLSSSWRSALAALCQSFLTNFAGSLVAGAAETLGTIRYTTKGVPIEGGPVFYPFNGGTIHGRIDSQRRRSGKESLLL